MRPLLQEIAGNDRRRESYKELMIVVKKNLICEPVVLYLNNEEACAYTRLPSIHLCGRWLQATLIGYCTQLSG